MTTQFLRLFPLESVVLFPGMDLPLVVFEPRYRQLTQECVDAGEPFGVLLLRSGQEAGDPDAQPYDVGTTARIEDVADLEDGRLSVQAVGEGRFRVLSLHRDLPYLAADVELLEEQPEDAVDPALAEQTRQRAGNVVQALMRRRGGWVRQVPLPDAPGELSYVVARMLQGNPAAQQHLLEMPTTTERLEREAALLGDVLDQITNAPRRGPWGPGFSRN